MPLLAIMIAYTAAAGFAGVFGTAFALGDGPWNLSPANLTESLVEGGVIGIVLGGAILALSGECRGKRERLIINFVMVFWVAIAAFLVTWGFTSYVAAV